LATGIPRRILITGAGGFVGRHMLAHLAGLASGPEEVLAIDRTIPRNPAPGANWVPCDLADRAQVAAVVARFRPEAILHLAAVLGGNDLQACFTANVLAAEQVLGASSSLSPMPRVVLVGSAAQYGSAGPGVTVVDESHPLNGETPYGVSKTMQERWALLYGTTRSLPVICTRPFNLLGPGQSTSLVPGAFMSQVQDVLQGGAAAVRVGNLSSRRDFVDVRDVVAAFWALLTTGAEACGKVFNISSGEATGIQELLDACLDLGGGGIPVERSADRMKAVDVSSMVGDASRLRAQTGWRATIPWRQSLADMWRHLHGQETGRG
jgi:GDP-4-dehydro-6-deoxy-D-mannose reductase